MYYIKLYTLILSGLLIGTHIHGQEKEITGKILDKITGLALPSVNILIKGTSEGTVSDADGSFSLTATPGDVLLFTSVGFQSQEIEVGFPSTVYIELSADIQTLSEVIVTGYSTDTKRQVTGSVATVAPKDLMVTPTGNVEQMLQGRVAGLTVITDGQPGTSSQVRIHGYGALRGPLYVVDGVPTETIDFLSPGDIQSMTVLKDASAASIYGARASGGVIVVVTSQGNKSEGMQVTYDGMIGVAVPGEGPSLLDPLQQAEWTWTAASNAFARFGLTPVFDHDQYGDGSVPVLPDWLLVGPESGVIGDLDLEKERSKYNIDGRLGPIYQVVPANKEGTNWYDAMTQNALIHRHNIGMSGGGENSQYYVGLSAQKQQGTVLHQEMERYSLRFNSAFDLLPGLQIGENIQVTSRSLKNIRGFFERMGGGNGAVDDENEILAAYTMAPIIPVYDQFGGYGGSAPPGVGGTVGGGINPVANLTRRQDGQNLTTSIFGNVFLEFEPWENLRARTSFGGEYQSWHSTGYFPRTYEQATNISSFGHNQWDTWRTQWVWTNTLSYEPDLGLGHNLKLLFGQEALNIGSFRDIFGIGNNPFSETVNYINLSTVENKTVSGGHSNGINFSSYFGRLMYEFMDKYQATLVVRRDGSSRFSELNRWGTFPAVSIGWRISEEQFISNASFINDLRLRAGYGEMGNSNNIPANNQFSIYGTNVHQSSYAIGGTNHSAESGFYRVRIGNPQGQWETAITKYIGLDARLWNGKFDLSVDFWREDTEDLLFPFPITAQAGNFIPDNWPWQNLGEMRNQGVDLRINTIGNISNEFSYNITFNGSFLSNKMINMGPGRDNLPEFSRNYRGIVPTLNLVGASLASFYGYQVEGLFSSQSEVEEAPYQPGAAPGRFRYRDINLDDSITIDDRTVLGNPIADFTGGISASLFYRNFELQLYGYASIGNEIYNLTKWHTDFFDITGSAISNRVLNSWSFENPQGTVPIFEYVSPQNFSTNTQSSSYYVEDGSYFRLQNITLAYNFHPGLLERWGLSNFKIAASVNNLFTITNYSGLDPNVAGAWDHRFGIDLGNFPVNKSYTIGVNLGF